MATATRTCFRWGSGTGTGSWSRLRLRTAGFEVETELTLQTLAKRCKIKEVPVSYTTRPEGSESKLNTVRDGLLIAGQPVWQPLVDEADPGAATPQALAYDSAADLLAAYLGSQ